MTCSTGNRFVDFLVFSNLWVSASAGLLTYAVARITFCDDAVDLSILIAGGTAVMYGFIRLSFYYTNDSKVRNHSFEPFRFPCWATAVIGGFLAMSRITETTIEDFYVLLPAFILTTLYPKKESQLQLREVPALKIWIISSVWVLCCFAFPILHSDVTESSVWTILVLISVGFTLIIGATIPFDMRDLIHDSPTLRTIPQSLGIHSSRMLVLALICLSAFGVFVTSFYLPEAIFLLAAHAGIFVGAIRLRNMTNAVAVPLIFEGSLMLPSLLLMMKELV